MPARSSNTATPSRFRRVKWPGRFTWENDSGCRERAGAGMALEMRQQMKLTQQLVMTPQLQQAIKLLQLSRLELQEVVQQELEENPVLDETLEIEEPKEPDTLELSEQETVPLQEAESFQELKVNEDNIREMDWDTFLEGYNYSSGDQYN